jgi:hypothetical protein
VEGLEHLVAKWVVALMLILIFPLGWTDAEAGYRGPFEGWIVDAETKEPIEGVVVFVDWVQAHMDSGRTDVDVAETLTDAEGYFIIPTWWSFNPWKNFTTEGLVTIFKSGYEPILGGPWNALLEREWGMPKGTYIWKIENGQPVILLKKVLDIDQRRKNEGLVDIGRPTKDHLLLKEINKERQFLGLKPIPIN